MNTFLPMLSSTKTITVLGCGWLGMPLLKFLAASGYFHLRGSSRQADRRQEITAAGGRALSVNLPQVDEATAKLAFGVDVLIVTLPPGRRREAVQKVYGEEIAAIIRLAKQHATGHIIYTSSTGVYGNAKGIVNEETAVDPQTDSARAVVAAEEQFRASVIPSTILRLAGLFGPDREPGRWFQGGRTLKQGDAPLNLVHQADVIQAVGWVIAQGAWNKTYNLSAAAHPPKGEFYAAAAQELGLEPPTVEWGGADGKQVSSEKIRQELGWQPAFELDG